MKLRTKTNEKPSEIKWTHDRNYNILHWRDGRIKVKAEGVSKEEDGSLRFQSVTLKDTGTYTYTVTSSDGTEIAKDKVEIKVYEKVPKPTVKFNCTADGNATLSCDVGNSKDPSLTVSWRIKRTHARHTILSAEIKVRMLQYHVKAQVLLNFLALISGSWWASYPADQPFCCC
ncbi:uncharacterized protein [Chanodichthys erythropterus]